MKRDRYDTSHLKSIPAVKAALKKKRSELASMRKTLRVEEDKAYTLNLFLNRECNIMSCPNAKDTQVRIEVSSEDDYGKLCYYPEMVPGRECTFCCKKSTTAKPNEYWSIVI